MNKDTNPFRQSSQPIETASDSSLPESRRQLTSELQSRLSTSPDTLQLNPFGSTELLDHVSYNDPVSKVQRTSSSAPRNLPNRTASCDSEFEGNVKPPSYLESEGRLSAPNLSLPSNEKAATESPDDRYRQGYEEGIRTALQREKERRHEMRKLRQMRENKNAEEPNHERSAERSGSRRLDVKREHANNPSSSSRNHSHNRDHSPNRRGSRRTRSKSESAANKGKPNASLDVIDKLDATGIYGGSQFHHDGPFDACAPHRNQAKGRGMAPISAFPADGPNNSLKVENIQPLISHKANLMYGTNGSISEYPGSFDPTDLQTQLHGESTMALGSSTFIDGTIASRGAIECDDSLKRATSLGRSFLRRVGSTAGQSRRYSNDSRAHN